MTDTFELDIIQLKDISRAFEKKIEQGLCKDHQQIRCLPTFIPSIRVPDTGDAYVLDLGGTNVRAAIVSFKNGNCSIKNGPYETKMPWMKNTILDRDIYLKTQLSALEALDSRDNLPLGYCFSYPAESTFDGDARLIKWTKEINIPGIIGENVGSQLLRYISVSPTHVKSYKAAVINDTVASLTAGLTLPRADAYIGLIVGTGTNMATFMDTGHIPKLEDSDIQGRIPVNLESGNFTPPHLTRWDDAVDKESLNKGEQRFEKAVSGAYLGEIFKAVYPESGFDASSGAKGIADILNRSGGNSDMAFTALQIYDRSAKLTAACLAGLIQALNSQETLRTLRIVAEGSLFWGRVKGEKRYLSTTRSCMESILRASGLNDIDFKFEHIENANLIGSAIAALS